jgi:hypothetical protein
MVQEVGKKWAEGWVGGFVLTRGEWGFSSLVK